MPLLKPPKPPPQPLLKPQGLPKPPKLLNPHGLPQPPPKLLKPQGLFQLLLNRLNGEFQPMG